MYLHSIFSRVCDCSALYHKCLTEVWWAISPQSWSSPQSSRKLLGVCGVGCRSLSRHRNCPSGWESPTGGSRGECCKLGRWRMVGSSWRSCWRPRNWRTMKSSRSCPRPLQTHCGTWRACVPPPAGHRWRWGAARWRRRTRATRSPEGRWAWPLWWLPGRPSTPTGWSSPPAGWRGCPPPPQGSRTWGSHRGETWGRDVRKKRSRNQPGGLGVCHLAHDDCSRWVLKLDCQTQLWHSRICLDVFVIYGMLYLRHKWVFEINGDHICIFCEWYLLFPNHSVQLTLWYSNSFSLKV